MKSVNKVHNKNKADDWIVTDIASFAPFIYGKGLPEGKRINNGHFPVYGSNGVIGFHDKPLVKSPTVIVGRKGTIGSVHFCEGGCWPIDTTFYYTINRYIFPISELISGPERNFSINQDIT